MSFQVFLFPILAIVFVGLFFAMRKRAVQSTHDAFKDFVIGPLAARLGLSVVKGDPQANLLATPQLLGQQKAEKGEYEWHVLLEGAPRGRPAVVEYYEHQRDEQGLTGWTRTYTTNIHMSARTTYQGQIEITSKKGSLGTPERRHPLPLASFGDPLLDQEFNLATRDPAVGPKLREHIHGIDANLRAYGLHLVVDRGMVSIVASRQAAQSVLWFVTTVLPALEAIAAELER